MTRNDEATLSSHLGSSRLDLDSAVGAAKALAHPARLRLLAMLRGGELCVCQLTAALDLATSTVSGHLAELRRAGLVEEDKRGRWVYYRLPAEGPAPSLGRRALALVEGDARVRDDAARIAEIRRLPREVVSERGAELVTFGTGWRPEEGLS